MKKFFRAFLLSIMVVVLALSLFSCKTSAIWHDQGSDTKKTDGTVAQTNGSEKYIVFAALNASGNLITRPLSGDPEETVAYAVVGYSGTVQEVVVPDTYNNKPVTKVLSPTPYANYYCYRNGAAYSGDDVRLCISPVNTVFKSLVLGSNVSYVGKGSCVGMINLKNISFLNDEEVEIGDGAFAASASLTSVTFATTSGETQIGSNNFAAGVIVNYAS